MVMSKFLINRKVRAVAFWVLFALKLLFWGLRLTANVNHSSLGTGSSRPTTITLVVKFKR